MSQTCSAVRKFLQNEATAKNLRREGRAQRGCDQAESKEVEVACFSPRFPEENAPAWAKVHATGTSVGHGDIGILEDSAGYSGFSEVSGGEGR